MEEWAGRFALRGRVLFQGGKDPGPKGSGGRGPANGEKGAIVSHDVNIVGSESDIREVASVGRAVVGNHADPLLPYWNHIVGADSTASADPIAPIPNSF